MSELEQLLLETVDGAVTPPDLGDIERRVRIRQRRRIVGRAVVSLMLTTGAVAAVTSLPQARSVPEIVGNPDSGPEGGTVEVVPEAPGSQVRPSLPPSVPQPGARTEAPRQVMPERSGDTAPPATDPDALPSNGSPVSEGCRVELDETPCTYTATRPGGYETDGSGDWTVTIERGGQTITINGEVDPQCGSTGTIQVGDRVTVDASRGTRPVLLTYGGHSFVAVGTEYGTTCG